MAESALEQCSRNDREKLIETPFGCFWYCLSQAGLHQPVWASQATLVLRLLVRICPVSCAGHHFLGEQPTCPKVHYASWRQDLASLSSYRRVCGRIDRERLTCLAMQAFCAYTVGMNSKRKPKTVQLTVRGVPSVVKAVLDRRAQSEQKSLNTVLVELLSMAAGVGDTLQYTDLDELAGKWQEDPDFDEALRAQDQVDESFLIFFARDRHFDHLPQIPHISF